MLKATRTFFFFFFHSCSLSESALSPFSYTSFPTTAHVLYSVRYKEIDYAGNETVIVMHAI